MNTGEAEYQKAAKALAVAQRKEVRLVDKLKIVGDAQAHFATVYEPRISNKAQACLHWAAAAQWALLQNKFQGESMIMAGSASFQMRVKDDGISDTHFTYQFEQKAAMARLAQGLLPEMHAWLVTREKDDMQLIDLSTGYQREQCERILGNAFDSELIPPAYLWCSTDEIPKQFLYKPDLFATRIAHSIMAENLYTNITCITNKLVRK